MPSVVMLNISMLNGVAPASKALYETTFYIKPSNTTRDIIANPQSSKQKMWVLSIHYKDPKIINQLIAYFTSMTTVN
jgi:hypothetical protein